jgi:Uma2 family endonuclease
MTLKRQVERAQKMGYTMVGGPLGAEPASFWCYLAARLSGLDGAPGGGVAWDDGRATRVMTMKRAVAWRVNVPDDSRPHVPRAARRLPGFRAWAQSDCFPKTGRIDYLDGKIDIDMSPEDLQTHGTLKAALAAELFLLIAKPQQGYVFVDRTRVTSTAGGLSAEPDVVVALFSSLDAGRVRQVPSAQPAPGRFVELEGAPDLVVEIVSDSSEIKDTERLPLQYAQAGIPELWLLDARGSEVRFEVRLLVTGIYQRVEPDAEGWTASALLKARCRVTRQPAPHDGWLYALEVRPA